LQKQRQRHIDTRTLSMPDEFSNMTSAHPQIAKRADAHDPVDSSALRMFRAERRFLVRIFEVLLPSRSDARLALGARDVPMGSFVDDLLRSAPLKSVLGIRLSLWVILLSPLFFGHFRWFLSLREAAQIALLERLKHNDGYVLREAVFLLKTISSLGYCGLPHVQSTLGIAPVDRKLPQWAHATSQEHDRFVQEHDQIVQVNDRIIQVRTKNLREVDSNAVESSDWEMPQS
jgi:hypothetical protein